jgi:3D (Asp-Asp-Asp) domain-containing protein
VRTAVNALAPASASATLAITTAGAIAAITTAGAIAAITTAAAIAAASLLGACGSSAGGGPDAGGDGAPGSIDGRLLDAPPPGASLGSFDLTYYWVTAQADFSGPNDTTIYDPSCAIVATVPAAFASSLDIEGTGRLADDTVINVSGACGCARSPCYQPVDAQHPWGYGVQGRALVPFRTVAVDPSVVAYGTGLYLAEFDGVTMPGDPPWGGFVHDGCVIAGDTGGGIVGMHVDFFAALKGAYVTLDGELDLTRVTVHDGGARCPSM